MSEYKTDYSNTVSQIEAHVASWFKTKTTKEITEIKKKMRNDEYLYDEKDNIKKVLICIGTDYFEIKPDRYYLGKCIYSNCNDNAQLFIEYSRNWNIIFSSANDRLQYLKELLRLITDNNLLNILEQKKITVDQEDKRYGGRPLHKAIFCDNFDVVKLLLKYGADVTLRDDQGRTALDIAKWVGTRTHKKYIKLIKNHIKSLKKLNSDYSSDSDYSSEYSDECIRDNSSDWSDYSAG